jgi:hypothetical protein
VLKVVSGAGEGVGDSIESSNCPGSSDRACCAAHPSSLAQALTLALTRCDIECLE